MVCGYAEILKHSIIGNVKFFKWLSKNSHNVILRKKFKEFSLCNISKL